MIQGRALETVRELNSNHTCSFSIIDMSLQKAIDYTEDIVQDCRALQEEEFEVLEVS